MRVLFLTGEFPPMQGGVGDCTNEIALALAQRGVEVSVLTTNDERRTTNENPPLLPPPSSLHILRIIQKWSWSALAQIRKTISETRADIVHIQYQTAAFGMYPMINFAPRFFPTTAKCVVTFHDLRPMYLFPKAGRVRDWVTFQLARASDAVIATNDDDYNTLLAFSLKLLTCIPIGSNINPPPSVILNGVKNLQRATLRAQLGVQPDEILLCYFGFLNESKGGETLIHALAEIPNAKLLMLGGQTGASDGTNFTYLEKVKKEVGDRRLENRVIWTDFMAQEKISAHFYASDICVLPYRDGASYRRGTFMAALAHGMAIVTTQSVVTTNHDGASSRRTNDQNPSRIPHPSPLPLLRDGENVLLVPPENPRAIADAVNRIASNFELRARLQRGALETAQFFTWDKIADAHLELYTVLLK
jgi:glycosyltransferase involved in cell wall biosynthesis